MTDASNIPYGKGIPAEGRARDRRELFQAWHPCLSVWIHRARLLDAIERAGDAAAALGEHVRVHHGRTHLLVTEKFLNGPYVVARLQQVGGKRMAKRMAADGLGDAGRTRRRRDRARKNGIEHVMPADHAGTRICRQLHRRENVLPAPFARCPGVLPFECEWKLHLAIALFEVPLMPS